MRVVRERYKINTVVAWFPFTSSLTLIVMSATVSLRRQIRLASISRRRHSNVHVFATLFHRRHCIRFPDSALRAHFSEALTATAVAPTPKKGSNTLTTFCTSVAGAFET
jgi:hypothetical protein